MDSRSLTHAAERLYKAIQAAAAAWSNLFLTQSGLLSPDFFIAA